MLHFKMTIWDFTF